MFTNFYKRLKSGFDQSWFKFLFKYTSLGRLLTQEEQPNAFIFINTYLSSWWWNRLCVRFGMEDDHRREFELILSITQGVKKHKFWTEQNLKRIFDSEHPQHFFHWICSNSSIVEVKPVVAPITAVTKPDARIPESESESEEEGPVKRTFFSNH